MSKTKTKAKGAMLTTYVEVAEAIYAIGDYERQIAKLDIGFKEAHAQIKKMHEEQSQPIAALRDLAIAGVVTYCEAHRLELTDNGKTKTASFTSGKVSWRHRPPSCKLPKDQSSILEWLKRMDLKQFIRVTEEVSKEALLADAAFAKTIPLVKIGSEGEDIIVEPFSTESLEAAS
jgi:phage host-nuclease inhibitor protein Gam